MLKETYGKKNKLGTTIGLRLSREEMAEMVGTTQETAIRFLSEFKKEGWIQVKDREVTILKPKSLLKIANLEK
jgi:CRP/FNR family transcriptional regulator